MEGSKMTDSSWIFVGTTVQQSNTVAVVYQFSDHVPFPGYDVIDDCHYHVNLVLVDVKDESNERRGDTSSSALFHNYRCNISLCLALFKLDI